MRNNSANSSKKSFTGSPWFREQQVPKQKRLSSTLILAAMATLTLYTYLGFSSTTTEHSAFVSQAHTSQSVSSRSETTTSGMPSPQVYVIDGDTIYYNSEKIRIANIDTPEISQAKCDAELKQGLEAKAALKELLDGKKFNIARGDPKTGRTTDKYGRSLARVSVNGRDVGEMLVQRGLARSWSGKRMSWC